ncbi:DUF4124 domain-containing protein [Nevskia sp.]|uniref:DUF4124 domain-containing protein n=1 Tax=Nevskia sp. TaxID=1929292 RepID=UPI0025E05FE7|nr:DUF4124 domain-containing protein [Nevskia sp.]
MARAEYRRLALALLLLSTGAEAASVYKWLDRDGLVHYDDQARLQQRLTRDYLDDRRIPSRLDATTPPAFIKAVAGDCAIARERADLISTASALYGSDPAGNVYPLSARQQVLEGKFAERDIGRYCAPNAAERLYREMRAERLKEKPAPVVVERRGP